MRALYCGIVIALFFLLYNVAFAADLTKMQAQALAMTAQLNGNCSATLIYSDRDKKSGDVQTVFLTAKHCIQSKEAVQYLDLPVYQNGRVVKRDRYTAKVKGQHFRYDLALVELLDKETWFEATATLYKGKDVPAMGSPVITVGYPLGLQLTVTQGLFGSLETLDFPKTGTEYYRATPDIVGGNSGGAMYLVTEKGDYEIIGVSAAGHRSYTFISLYVPTYAIHEYLKVALPSVVK